MNKHTPEPWRTIELDRDDDTVVNIHGEDDWIISKLWIRSDFKDSGEEIRANARRIVACVNACCGLPTDELEQKGLVAAVGTQLLAADERSEGQEREIRKLARTTADAENKLADALNQRDELLAALDDITNIKWRDGLAGLDRPTDFAERESAIRALGSAMTIARTAISKVKGV